MNDPNRPTVPDPQTPAKEPAPSPQNPDPKTHPIHREVPEQPIHEGTDPPRPVTR